MKSNYLPDIKMIQTLCRTVMMVTAFERAEWGCSHSKDQRAQFTPELKSKTKELRAKRAIFAAPVAQSLPRLSDPICVYQ